MVDESTCVKKNTRVVSIMMLDKVHHILTIINELCTLYMLTRNVSLQPLELSIHCFISAVLGIFS